MFANTIVFTPLLCSLQNTIYGVFSMTLLMGLVMGHNSCVNKYLINMFYCIIGLVKSSTLMWMLTIGALAPEK